MTFKGIFLFAGFLLAGLTLQAQAPEAETFQEFAAIYTTGENWDDSLPPAGQPYFIEHSRFLSQLRSTGVIAVGMRVSGMGIIIVRARSLEEAEKLFAEDVSVAEKTFKLEVQPATVFYKGCLGGI